MSTLKDLRNSRLEKLEKLKSLGVDCYPAKSHRDTEIGKIIGDFEGHENREVVVAGRVVSLRSHGSIIFIDLKDASGKIQILAKKENLSSANHENSELVFEELDLLDEGDFIEAHGTVIKSQRGEVSVEAKQIRILTKAIRPMPGSWDGLKDKETRLRRRYLDTNLNPEVYQRYLRRAKFWEAHREFFKNHGFYEINIPVLELVPGGADANPFVTHMDAIDQDFYLRISQELYLKPLIGGGYEKVYEIGPRFRNEGMSDEHLPEHIAMEFYWAYADYNDGMEFIRELFRYVAQEVYGTLKFKMRGFDVDLDTDWEKIDYVKLMKDKIGLDVLNPDDAKIQEVLKSYKIRLPKYSTSRAIDHIWKELRKEIAGPAFIVGEPKALSPLAKSDPQNPLITQRFHPILAGSELGNAFSELNDPQDQLARFREQQVMRESGDAEAQFLDIDFVEMLEYGMPPTFGYGHSERVFWFFEDVPAKEGVPFPQLKFELDESTIEIYGL
jgi:lysyl-tRNA synthetase class 2